MSAKKTNKELQDQWSDFEKVSTKEAEICPACGRQMSAYHLPYSDLIRLICICGERLEIKKVKQVL